jgi:hypothetical protein
MLTPDGLIFLQILGSALVIYFLWIIWQLVTNKGMARIHKIFLLGWHGACLAPWCILVYINCEKTIPAHERIHAKQQLELGKYFGFLKFWWIYATNTQKRLAWEVEAYKESYRLNPAGLNNYAFYLRQYGTNLTHAEAINLLTK